MASCRFEIVGNDLVIQKRAGSSIVWHDENPIAGRAAHAFHRVGREVRTHVTYKGHVLAVHRIDMVVDERLIIKTKATLETPQAAERQLLNYLRATNLEVGLLLHFGPEARFRRVVSTNKPRNK